MSCEFSIGNIEFPRIKLTQIRDLLKKHDLDWVLLIGNEDNEIPDPYIYQDQTEMSYSTASEITDDLFPELAELLNNTPEDGQLIETSCDGDKTSYFLYKGKVEIIPGDLVTIDLDTPIEVGEKDIADIRVRVLGLPGGKAAILEYNAKDGE